MDWRELVRLLRDGDAAAGPMLISAVAPGLYAYAKSLAPNLPPVDREIAVEAAMEKVVRRIERYDETRASLPTWARAFVRHELAELTRQPHAIPTDPNQLPSQPPRTPGDTDDDDPRDDLTSEQAAAISLLFALPETDVIVVQLHLADHLTHKEIAERIGSTEGAVKTRYSRAISKLRAIAADHPDLRHLAATGDSE